MLTCPKCNKKQSETEAVVTRKPLFAGGYHMVARCHLCNAFIKNLPHSEGSDKLYFGKYKGKFMCEVADTDKRYLEWLLSQDIKETLKAKIRDAIAKSEAKNKQEKINLNV